MNTTTNELKSEIKRGLCFMRGLRDEVRVKVHLASLDVKAEWNKLEPQLAELEERKNEFTDETCTALRHALDRLSKLRKSLT